MLSEYVVREDILMSMEELNLPDDQAMALLKAAWAARRRIQGISANWKPNTWKRCAVRSESFAERKAAKDRNWEAR